MKMKFVLAFTSMVVALFISQVGRADSIRFKSDGRSDRGFPHACALYPDDIFPGFEYPADIYDGARDDATAKADFFCSSGATQVTPWIESIYPSSCFYHFLGVMIEASAFFQCDQMNLTQYQSIVQFTAIESVF